MDAETTERLDRMERKLIDKVWYCIRNGYTTDADSCSRALVNIAMYRRRRATR